MQYLTLLRASFKKGGNYMDTRTRTLVMFSGGKDSFITACKRVDEGDYVGLLSFNNGSVVGEQNFKHGATRLVNRYGEDNIHYEGVYNTAAIVMSLKQWFVGEPLESLGELLPKLPLTQLTCFHCQTAMWVAAIAYAKAKGFHAICTGYRSSDEFCTGTDAYLTAMKGLAEAHALSVYTPVWEYRQSDRPWEFERDSEMMLRRFQPSVYEPKCLLGMPAIRLTQEQIDSLMFYYDYYLRKLVCAEIERTVPVFDTLDLGDVSLPVPEYPLPDSRLGYC